MHSNKRGQGYVRKMDDQINGNNASSEYCRILMRDCHQESNHDYNVPKAPIEIQAMKSHMVELLSHNELDEYEVGNITDTKWSAKLENIVTESVGNICDEDIDGGHNENYSKLSGSVMTNLSISSANNEQMAAARHWYHKIAISGEKEATLALEEVEEKASLLFTAIRLRKQYMELSHQEFCRTTDRYLDLVEKAVQTGEYNENIDYYLQPAAANTNLAFKPPPTKGNSFKVDKNPTKLEDHTIVWRDGLAEIVGKDQLVLYETPIKYLKYLRDYQAISEFVSDGPLKSFCFRRLNFLKYRFQMHTLLNEWQETAEQKSVAHRDFYNIRKVDTHIHASSSMNQKHLSRFIKKCIKTKPDEKVLLDKTTGKVLTLQEVFTSLNIKAQDITIDKLDVHCDRDTFHRFDKFNAKYNPLGQSELREIFLKSDNYSEGKLFASLLKEVIEDLEESKYQSSEMRLSIYGKSLDEWDKLAKWAINNDVYSDHVKWMIQFPRIYDIFKAKNMIDNFQQILENIFTPLFEVTLDPESHPELHRFLCHISGFDSVDDESKPEPFTIEPNTPKPQNWDHSENPPYAYYVYFTYANMATLNRLRADRGLNCLKFRPHCGEAGHIQHLVSTFLLSESINHGLLLRKAPVLQYLYYLCQVGLAMSPLSNNSLFLDYHRNPVHDFYSRGLNVSLSTDDPLQFHYTKEALIEEYSVAAQIWKLCNADMCELSRNSVLMSGFSDEVKSYWLGADYKEEGCRGNDMTRTNVPNIRIAFRFEALICELNLLLKMSIQQKHLFRKDSDTGTKDSEEPKSN